MSGPPVKRKIRVAIAPETETAQWGDTERLDALRKQRDECVQACAQITQQLTLLEDAEKRREIESIALSPEKKLIDLLVERILDPEPNWRSKIDILINIPNSLSGGGILRGGSYFEALFQLIIAMGELSRFRGPKTFYDIKGYKTKTTLNNYIHTKDVKNAGGGETGIADIMFSLVSKGKSQSTEYACGEPPPPEARTDVPHYFISVKGYRKEKSIAHGYDVPLLSQQLTVFPEIKNRNIIVCVRNKEDFLTRLSRTQQEFLKNSISEVIGYDEVMDAFEAYRTRFFLSVPPTSGQDVIRARVMELFPKDDTPKPMLSMYFHQELVVKSVVARILAEKDTREPHFMCIGVLPRGGKSFIAGGIIDALRKSKGADKPFNVLFLTSAISETREQFKGDLVEKFAEFSTFTFVDPVRGAKGDEKSNKFVFVSRQLSSKKVGGEEEEEEESVLETDIVKLLSEKLGGMPTFDVCFFDEAHLGIKSESVRENFAKAFTQFKMPIVLMTATYSKPARALKSDADLFVWDLQDIKDMKSLPSSGYDAFLASGSDILRRYPGTSAAIISNRRALGETEEQIAAPYINFPSPNFISLTFAPDTIKHLRDTGTGYDYARAFKLRESKSAMILNPAEYTRWGSLLENREDAMRIRQFLTPEQEPEEESGFLQDADRKYRALNQIFRIAEKSGSRPIRGRPFSMLMFLPFGGEHPPIGELCRVWASFMRESPYWRDNFVFLTLSTITNKKYKPLPNMTPALAVERGIGHREDFKTELKETIRNIERAALEKNKGLVLLSGDVAKMGISLKCVDVVCLMSTNKDSDDIIQKMYRALTDDAPFKKNGFIIDLNMKRIITAMFNYDMEKAKRSLDKTAIPTPDAAVASLFELCNWGQDAFIEDEAAKGMTFNDVYNDIKTRVIDDLVNYIALSRSTKVAEKQVEIIFDNSELKTQMMRILKGTSSNKKKTAKPEVLAVRNTDIPDAIEGTTEPRPEREGDEKEEEAAPLPGLSDEQIRAKMGDILITFANALVVRSSEPWKKDIDFATLFAKFLADKSSATRICDCSLTTSCKTPHTNIYDSVYCEIKPYAISASGSYDNTTHTSIMDLVESVFQTSSALNVEWTSYVRSLMSELDTSAVRGGVRHKTTRKKHNTKIRHGRRTYRQRP